LGKSARFTFSRGWAHLATIVRQALVDGMPIEVASELAGHASIDTTSIYSTQELARKIKAVQGMKRRVVV
jgi:integrase